ncbi:MAG: S-layer homology domain-containing protein [Eubacteriales bacterium]
MKKVLALVLTLALVLSSFSMAFADDKTAPAAAAPAKYLTDIAGNANAEAIGVVNDLGIVTGNPDGTFQPTKAVTRAEFAAMITRALAIPNSALSGYATTSFKDTDGYGWAVGYLAFCNSKGIMLGDGQGNAMPGKTVTLNEAVTMSLRAIGYTPNSSHLKGNWPASYVTKAQELSLYDYVAKDLVEVDKANAAQLIYNLLPINKVAVDTDGQTRTLSVNLLTAGLNCSTSGEQVITVDDLDYCAMNLAKHIGEYGEKYTNNTTKKVVAFMPKKNTAKLVGRFVNAATAGEYDFVTSDTELTYTIRKNPVNAGTTTAVVPVKNLMNGEGRAVYNQVDDIANFSTMLATNAAIGKEVAIYGELSGKVVKQVYSVNTWNTNKADKAPSDVANDIKSKRLLGIKFPENDNKEIDINQFELVGVNTINDIKKDDVLYVYSDPTDKVIRKIEVGTQTVEGKVYNFKNGSSSNGLASIFKVGDKNYKNAIEVVNTDYVGSTSNKRMVKPNDTTADVKLILDGRGYVFEKISSTKANKIAVVTNKKTEDEDIDSRVKLFLADGTKKTFTYDDATAKVPANDGKSTDNKPYTKGVVIGYGLNKDGEINSANHNYEADVQINLKSNNLVAYTIAGKTKYAVVDDAVVAFTYKGAGATPANRGDYKVTSVANIKKNTNIKNAVLLFEDDLDLTGERDTNVVGIMVPADMAKVGEKKYALVSYVYHQDGDGEHVQRFNAYVDGEWKTELQTSDLLFPEAESAPAKDLDALKTNDNAMRLYEIKMDAKGIVTDATLVNPAKQIKANNSANINNLVNLAEKKHIVKLSEALGMTDDRKSVHFVQETDGNYLSLPISKNARFYELTKDGYDTFSGNVKPGYFVKMYELDEEIGYDVVIVVRNY